MGIGMGMGMGDREEDSDGRGNGIGSLVAGGGSSGGSGGDVNAEIEDKQVQMQAEGTSGQVVFGGKETQYVGATHCAAILDDVKIRSFANIPTHRRYTLLTCSTR